FRRVLFRSDEDVAVKEVREELIALQSDPQLSRLAQTAIRDAERAVDEAEKPQKNEAIKEHLVYLASNKVKTAKAMASARYEEDRLRSEEHTSELQSRANLV